MSSTLPPPGPRSSRSSVNPMAVDSTSEVSKPADVVFAKPQAAVETYVSASYMRVLGLTAMPVAATAATSAVVSDPLPTLYTAANAPNPRRVMIFLAEMGYEDLVEYKEVDLLKGESRSEDILKINPTGGIPVLNVPGQGGIAESMAICRYLEMLHGVPEGKKSLFGSTPFEAAQVEMWNRRLDLKLFSGGVARVWLSSLVNKGAAKKLALKQTKNQLKFGQSISKKILEVIEEHLRSSGNIYLVGELFSVADITLTCCLDFAVGLAGLSYNSSHFPALEAYRLRVKERESVKKFGTPYVGMKYAGILKASKLYHMTLRG